MLGPVLDVIFPRSCAGCGRGPWPFCDGCRLTLVPLSAPWCERCGLPSERRLATCRECPPGELSQARAPFLFTGPMRSAIHRLKFAGWKAVAAALGEAMASVVEERPDAVTWVPLSRRRLSDRGFDQARALALVVARRLDRPAVRLLSRAGDTSPQARRSGAERRARMGGAFRQEGTAPPLVLLVDDVLTTGSTAAACARVLLEAGAGKVALVTAARAASAPPPPAILGSGSRPGLWLPGGGSLDSRCQPQAKRPT
ncbi:MAG: ComF family protein [Actinomycetota bacterium]